MAQRLDTARLVQGTLVLPQAGGHVGQQEASFGLPPELMGVVSDASVDMVAKWWGKDPGVRSPLRGAVLSSVLSLSLYSLDSTAASVGRRQLLAQAGNTSHGGGRGQAVVVTDSGAGSRRRQLGGGAGEIPLQLTGDSCINVSVPMTAQAYALSPAYIASW